MMKQRLGYVLMKIIIIILAIMMMNSCDHKQEPKVVNDSSKNQDLEARKDISDPNNKLTGKIETLELQYIVFGCACANWIQPKIYQHVMRSGESLGDKTIFIEPADETLRLPANFDPSIDRIIVTGQFYEDIDYPKGTEETEEVGMTLQKAPVFRYTKLQIDKL